MNLSHVSAWIEQAIGLSSRAQFQLGMSVVVLLGAWLANSVGKRLSDRRIADQRTRYQIQKLLGYFVTFLAVLLLAWVWLRGIGAAATYLGLLSAGVAIALRDPLVNFAAWFFIVWRRPFEVGDRIEIGSVAGDVIDQRIFQFSLLEIGNWVDADQSTGRVLHVPNAEVFSKTVANSTSGFDFIWDEVPVVLTFESDWRAAKGILESIIEEHARGFTGAEEEFRKAARRYLIVYSHFTPAVYVKVVDHGVKLTVRYLCRPRRRRGSQQQIWENILAAFSERQDIDFAYPTQRFFDHRAEGKTSATPSENSPLIDDRGDPR